MNFIRSRITLVLGILAFNGVFQWTYITWLYPTFGYLGFEYEEPLLSDLILAWTLSTLPAFWMALHIRRPSQLICWVLYLTVYIPSMFCPLFALLVDIERIRALMLMLFAGFAIIGLSNRLPLLKLWAIRLPGGTFWAGYWVVLMALITWVVMVYWGHFQLVGFHEVYESIRFNAREVSKGTGVGYAAMGLSGSLIPFLMSWALLKKRPVEFIFGVLVLIMLYSTAGLKCILISTVATPTLYVLMRGETIPFASKLTWLTVILFAGLNSANLAVGELGGFQMMLSAIVFGRTFGGPGILTAMYQDFFANRPLTYYSHLNGVNLFVNYPYEHGVGVELGYYYTGRMDLNSSAHFWCADGLAALGLPGIIVISILCAVVLWMLDSAATGHKPFFSATAVSFAALNLGNASLFTTLLSGGLFFLIFLLYVMPREAEETEIISEEEPEFTSDDCLASEDSPELTAGFLSLDSTDHSKSTAA